MAAQVLNEKNYDMLNEEQLINSGINLRRNKERYPLGELDEIYEAGVRKKYPGFKMISAGDYPPFKLLQTAEDFAFLINKYKYFLLFSHNGNCATFHMLKLAIESKRLDNVQLVLTLFTPARFKTYDVGHRGLVESLKSCDDEKIHDAMKNAGFIEDFNLYSFDEKHKQEVHCITPIDIDIPGFEQKLAKDKVRLHPKINRKDLYQNGSLLLPETIIALKKYSKENPEVVEIEPHQISLDPRLFEAFSIEKALYPVVFVNHVPFVLYRDRSKDNTAIDGHELNLIQAKSKLGQGDDAVCKEVTLIQNPESCEWFADKVHYGEAEPKEIHHLKLHNQFIGYAIVQAASNTVRSHLVMKLAHGKTITASIYDKDSPLPELLKNPELALKKLLKLFIVGLIKLNNMHNKNTIHNDLHAGNIMVDFENEMIELIDFGVSFDVSTLSERKKQQHKNEDISRFISNFFSMLPTPIKPSLWFNQFEVPEIRETLMKRENSEILQLLIGLDIKIMNKTLSEFSMLSLIKMCCQCYFHRFKEEIRLPAIQEQLFTQTDQQEITKAICLIREQVDMSPRQFNDAIYKQMKTENSSLDRQIQGTIDNLVIPACLNAKGLQESDRKVDLEAFNLEFLLFCHEKVLQEFIFRKNRVVYYPAGNHHDHDPKRYQHRLYFLALFRFAELCQIQIQLKQRMANLSVTSQALANANGVTPHASPVFTPAANTAMASVTNNLVLRGGATGVKPDETQVGNPGIASKKLDVD